MKIASVVFKDKTTLQTPAKLVTIKENWVEVYNEDFSLLTTINRDFIFCVDLIDMTEEEFAKKVQESNENTVSD